MIDYTTLEEWMRLHGRHILIEDLLKEQCFTAEEFHSLVRIVEQANLKDLKIFHNIARLVWIEEDKGVKIQDLYYLPTQYNIRTTKNIAQVGVPLHWKLMNRRLKAEVIKKMSLEQINELYISNSFHNSLANNKEYLKENNLSLKAKEPAKAYDDMSYAYEVLEEYEKFYQYIKKNAIYDILHADDETTKTKPLEYIY